MERNKGKFIPSLTELLDVFNKNLKEVKRTTKEWPKEPLFTKERLKQNGNNN